MEWMESFDPGTVASVLAGDVRSLKAAFIYKNTPEGRDFWAAQDEAGELTDVGKKRLAEMLALYKAVRSVRVWVAGGGIPDTYPLQGTSVPPGTRPSFGDLRRVMEELRRLQEVANYMMREFKNREASWTRQAYRSPDEARVYELLGMKEPSDD